MIHEADHSPGPVVITIFTQCPFVRPSQNFKIKRQSLPAGTVGWPSGSLMTPVLLLFFSPVHMVVHSSSHTTAQCSHKLSYFPHLENSNHFQHAKVDQVQVSL